MKLSHAAAQYIELKQSLGSRFHAEEVILKAFCRATQDTELEQVQPDQVRLSFCKVLVPSPVSGIANTKPCKVFIGLRSGEVMLHTPHCLRNGPNQLIRLHLTSFQGMKSAAF